jgi:hypothetical protein
VLICRLVQRQAGLHPVTPQPAVVVRHQQSSAKVGSAGKTWHPRQPCKWRSDMEG